MKPFLFRPVKPLIVNQGFGENTVCVDLATSRKVIMCNGLKPPKGYKSIYGAAGHKGIDLRASHGQPVYNAMDGIVYSIDTEARSGLDVRVRSVHNGTTYLHIYEHLLGYQPKLGQVVKAGDIIGWADNTGWSSGDHLHFELREQRGDKWISIDPLPLMSGIYAQDISSIQEKIARLAELIADLLRAKK